MEQIFKRGKQKQVFRSLRKPVSEMTEEELKKIQSII